MSNIVLQNFKTLVANASAKVQASSTQLIDLSVGSVLRAILEANALLVLWMERVAMQILSATRLSTSTGADVSSFTADFNLIREPAVSATTMMTFARYSASQSATIALGTLVQTNDGTQKYSVTQDTTNHFWNIGLGAYLVPSGVSSASLPVVALTSGTGANVSIGAINLPADSIAGIDTVNNVSAVINGVDEESDSALKARFPLYIASLEAGTYRAIRSAILGVQQGLTYNIAVNQSEDGSFRPGHFVCTVDDGSGFPSSDLKIRLYSAIDSVRALTETFSVQSPYVLYASVAITIEVDATGNKPTLLSQVSNSISAYINGLSVGQKVSLSKIQAIAFSVDSSIVNVTNATINGHTFDLVPTSTQVVKTNVAPVVS